ncbi:MAG: hypothetical protein Q7N50_14035, partial [Armatimonadota bacterium]|nr:hypothetical protein [Armatimonadota bacterium]
MRGFRKKTASPDIGVSDTGAILCPRCGYEPATVVAACPNCYAQMSAPAPAPIVEVITPVEIEVPQDTAVVQTIETIPGETPIAEDGSRFDLDEFTFQEPAYEPDNEAEAPAMESVIEEPHLEIGEPVSFETPIDLTDSTLEEVTEPPTVVSGNPFPETDVVDLSENPLPETSVFSEEPSEEPIPDEPQSMEQSPIDLTEFAHPEEIVETDDGEDRVELEEPAAEATTIETMPGEESGFDLSDFVFEESVEPEAEAPNEQAIVEDSPVETQEIEPPSYDLTEFAVQEHPIEAIELEDDGANAATQEPTPIDLSEFSLPETPAATIEYEPEDVSEPAPQLEAGETISIETPSVDLSDLEALDVSSFREPVELQEDTKTELADVEPSTTESYFDLSDFDVAEVNVIEEPVAESVSLGEETEIDEPQFDLSDFAFEEPAAEPIPEASLDEAPEMGESAWPEIPEFELPVEQESPRVELAEPETLDTFETSLPQAAPLPTPAAASAALLVLIIGSVKQACLTLAHLLALGAAAFGRTIGGIGIMII